VDVDLDLAEFWEPRLRYYFREVRSFKPQGRTKPSVTVWQLDEVQEVLLGQTEVSRLLMGCHLLFEVHENHATLRGERLKNPHRRDAPALPFVAGQDARRN
jgi:hypothetical protein